MDLFKKAASFLHDPIASFQSFFETDAERKKREEEALRQAQANRDALFQAGEKAKQFIQDKVVQPVENVGKKIIDLGSDPNLFKQIPQKVANVKIPTQVIPFAGQTIANIQNPQNPNKSTFTPKQVYKNIISPMWQGPAQFGAGLMLSAKGEQSYNPTDPLSKFVMGDKPVKNIQGQGADVSQTMKDIGINPTIANKAGVPLIVGMGLLNVVGGGKSKVATEAVDLARQAKTVEEFTSLLSKSKTAMGIVTGLIKDTKSPVNSIGDFFKIAKETVPTAAPKAVKVIDESVPFFKGITPTAKTIVKTTYDDRGAGVFVSTVKDVAQSFPENGQNVIKTLNTNKPLKLLDTTLDQGKQIYQAIRSQFTSSDIITGNEIPKVAEAVSKNLQKLGYDGINFGNEQLIFDPKHLTAGISEASNPVDKIIQALKEAKPIRGQQEALYAAERAKRAAKVAGAGRSIPGEQGYFAQLGALKGEMPKVQFEGIRNKLTSEDINSVFNTVEQTPYFSPFEKVTAKTGLAKLLGQEGGSVPNNSELKLLNEIFPPEFIKAAQGNRSLTQKIIGGIGQVASIPRSLMAGGADMSYGLRQGVFSGYSHPKEFASAFKDQFKYFFSEKALQVSSDAIKAHPNYKLAREAGLSLTDLGTGGLKPREEQFQSQLAEKIPILGRAVRATGRAYTGFANKYRFDIFNSLVDSAKKTGDFSDPKFLSNAGELVNTLTGRGSLGKFEKQAGVLSTTLFSPRLLASRLQLMNPQFYMKLQPAVRREALKSLVGYVVGTGTILGAAKLAGADVGTDPTNSDFAKIKVGNTRVDIMGGFQQPIVLLSRLLTGKMTSSTTGKTMTLGEGYKSATRFDIVQRFFESKEAPIVSFITSAIKGQNAIGEPFNASAESINRMIPMFISDMVDLYKDGGLSALPLGIPAFFGAGAQTYGKTELVTGKNKLGEPTSQISPIKNIGESISTKLFGQPQLGSSSSTNVSAYMDQLFKGTKEQAVSKFDQIAKTNPDLAKQIIQEVKDRAKGVTVDDQVLKAKGVASGDRAIEIIKQFNNLKTREEKATMWEHYVKVGIITPDVSKQLQGKLNP